MNPKPKPPMPGGEYTQFIDTGPQAVTPGATRVNLIPVGDGGPGPLLPRMTGRKKHKPLVPSRAEIEKLPRWARVAFAVRCARRVFPILCRRWPSAPTAHLQALENAVSVAERCASASDAADVFGAAATAYTTAASLESSVVLIASNAAGEADPDGGVYLAARAAAEAADVAYYAVLADPAPVRDASGVAATAAAAMLRVASDPSDLLFIRRDFERFRWLEKKHGWTDDTPVSPDAVGPLWPRGRVPHWAGEKKRPRE